MFVPDGGDRELVTTIVDNGKLSKTGIRLLSHDNYWAHQVQHKHRQGLHREPVVRPVFITGTGRTASSFLHATLRDSGFRVANVFEATTLCRTFKNTMLTGSYFLAHDIQRMIEEADAEAPEYAMVNPHQWGDPAEDIHFGRANYEVGWWLPHYAGTMDWSLKRMFADPVGDLEHLRSCAELLGVRGDRWCFRAPTHLMHLETLFEVFPDATVIWMERPEKQVLPGLRKMIHCMRRTRSEVVDAEEVDFLARSMAIFGPSAAETSIASGNIPVDQVVRVSFEDVTENTEATMVRLLDRLGPTETCLIPCETTQDVQGNPMPEG